MSSSGRILNRRTLPLKVFQDGPHRAQNPAIDFLPEFHQQNKATEKLPENSSGMGLVKYKRTCNAASREETRLLLEMGLLLLLAGFVGYSKESLSLCLQKHVHKQKISIYFHIRRQVDLPRRTYTKYTVNHKYTFWHIPKGPNLGAYTSLYTSVCNAQAGIERVWGVFGWRRDGQIAKHVFECFEKRKGENGRK